MRIRQASFILAPSVADPAHVIKMVLIKDSGSWIPLSTPKGIRMWWRRFLVWAVRRHVQGLNYEI